MQGTWSRAIRLGITSLLLHKLRSFLTTLGVLCGTAAVIAMLAIGEGLSYDVQEQIKQLGSQNVIVRSVKPPEDPNPGNQRSRVLTYGITEEDRQRIAETFPGVDQVVPVRQIFGEVRVADRVLSPRVLATLPAYIDVTGRLVYEGRFIADTDESRVANVCVLGTEVARYLFPFQSAIGETVKIGRDYYRVVGTLAPRVRLKDDAPQAGQETTDEVYIPLETGGKWYGNVQVKMRAGSMDMEEVELHELILAVDKPENVSLVANATREMMSRNHKQRDYEVVVPLELLARAEETKRMFNLVLGLIAGISLLVGGIGIMNVMLATVTERTREIGIRRALGARKRHIVSQFLIETVVLSVGGGLLGVLAGFLLPLAIEHFSKMTTIVTPAAPILAFLISAGVGIVFGLYPAWRAASMDPVEALRHE
ncbi:MAG: FtsX-like permease family protein [Planctomycetes bacterium]|nr:FtsX-like permease family protein [Planctomycetota bacterium]